MERWQEFEGQTQRGPRLGDVKDHLAGSASQSALCLASWMARTDAPPEILRVGETGHARCFCRGGVKVKRKSAQTMSVNVPRRQSRQHC